MLVIPVTPSGEKVNVIPQPGFLNYELVIKRTIRGFLAPDISHKCSKASTASMFSTLKRLLLRFFMLILNIV